MDHPQPTFTMESHAKFYTLYLGGNDFGPGSVKIDVYQPSSSVIPKEYRKNTKIII